MRLPILKQPQIGVTLDCLLLIFIDCQLPRARTLVLVEMSIIGLFLFSLGSGAVLEVLVIVSTVGILFIKVVVLSVALKGSFLKLAVV